MKFDTIDAAIIRALQQDGTRSQNALAELVGASPASCWRRVRALEAAGVLGKTVRLADPAALGLAVNVLCNIRLNNHLPATSIAFERWVENSVAVIDCFAVTGDWDYQLRVVAVDIAAYERLLRGEILANPAVAAASSTLILSIRKRTTELPVA